MDAGLFVVRADSSSLIGTGHVMRCLTLAERYKSAGHTVHFICRDLAGNIASLVEQHGFVLHWLPRHALNPKFKGYEKWLTVTQEEDAQETTALLKTLPPITQLIVDSYSLDETWEKAVRPYVQKIFVLDDLANRPHDCDFLLDQNLYPQMEHRYDNLVSQHCQKFLGPRYALLRDEFYQARKRMPKKTENLKRILVFYGGADVTNETARAVRVLLSLRKQLPNIFVDVIIGASNVHREEITSFCQSPEAKDWLHCHDQVANMAEYMAKADLCLGAGGTTTWERCFLGLPTIVTAVAENQVAICQGCGESNLIRYLGKTGEVTAESLRQEILKATEPMILRAWQKSCSLDIPRRTWA